MRLWKKAIAAMTAGVLCVGSVGMTGLQGVLESVGTVLSASAYVPSFYDKVYGDLYYSVTDDGEIEILGCNEDVVSVEIPAEIDGRPVTSIGGSGFSGCKSLTGIIIPNSVTSIGSYAFNGTPWLAAKQEENPLVIVNGILIDGTTCTGSITIPEGVTSIGDDAFSLCKNLTEVTIPDSMTNIGKSAFKYCENLTEITIPYGVISIEESVFYSCTSLTEITIPNSVTNIGPNAFDYCTKLTNITIPNSVTSIGYDAFCACESLTEITIPDSVESIGTAAFKGCKSLTKVIIPDSVTSIGSFVFDDTPWLTGKQKENPLVIINEILIDGKTCAGSVTIPDSVTAIGGGAFYGCAGLTEISIPDSVTSIGVNAFGDTPWLAAKRKENPLVVVNGILIDGRTCTESAIIPDGVTSIGDDAFGGCFDLMAVIIPDSVTYIEEYAFEGCENLTIYGYTGSYAETYANENDFPFVSLGDVTTTEPTTTTTTETTTTAITTTTTAAPITGGLVCGDINLDGRVDITDAVLLNKFCSGAITLEDTAKKNADCNGDGEPGSGDAVVLLQFLVHIVDTLPYSA